MVASRTSTGKVLVIEDDPDVALAIKTVLRRGRFDVVSAGDGSEGLRIFHAQRPDLVVLDLGLPVIDGWAVLARIRAVSAAPVLLLTAHSLAGGKVQALKAGADDYLTKPFGNDELLAKIQVLLGHEAAEQDPAVSRPATSTGAVGSHD